MQTKLKLAVFTQNLGLSFIDKHISGIARDDTVAIGSYGSNNAADLWPVRCPVLLIDQTTRSLKFRVAKKLGLSQEAMLERKISQFLRSHGVNVILGEFLDYFLPYASLATRLGLPYIVQGHGIDVSAALRQPGMAETYVKAYQSAHRILTRSEFHRQRLISIGLPADRISVNIGGVDVPEKMPIRDPDAWLRFLAIGRMVPKKAPFILLEAFRKAAAVDARLTLDYVGAGAFFPAVEEYVRAAGLSNRVRLHGTASEVIKNRLISECGVFVQHSITARDGDEEGLPAAIQEAMASGMAVVSTRHAGISEAVTHKVTGLLVDEGDVIGMSEAFLTVPTSASEYGAAGYKEAVQKHAWKQERDRLIHWLEACTG